jgi:hypothetical protein
MGIEIDHGDFLSSVQPVKLAPGRRLEKNSPVNESELSQSRAALGNLSYLARESRVDLAGPTAILQGRMPKITIDDVNAINRVVGLAGDFRLRVQPIPPEKVAVLCFVDAAHQNVDGGRSQGGYLVCFADESINEGAMASISPAMWKSRRLRRRAVSTTHSEVQGISEGMAASEYLRLMWQESCVVVFSLGQPYRAENMILGVSVADCKSGFDPLNNPTAGPSSDRRCAVDVAVVRTSLTISRTVLHWVDGAKQQLTDALTKLKGNADLFPGSRDGGTVRDVEEKKALQMKEEQRALRKERAAGQALPCLSFVRERVARG